MTVPVRLADGEVRRLKEEALLRIPFFEAQLARWRTSEQAVLTLDEDPEMVQNLLDWRQKEISLSLLIKRSIDPILQELKRTADFLGIPLPPTEQLANINQTMNLLSALMNPEELILRQAPLNEQEAQELAGQGFQLSADAARILLQKGQYSLFDPFYQPKFIQQHLELLTYNLFTIMYLTEKRYDFTLRNNNRIMGWTLLIKYSMHSKNVEAWDYLYSQGYRLPKEAVFEYYAIATWQSNEVLEILLGHPLVEPFFRRDLPVPKTLGLTDGRSYSAVFNPELKFMTNSLAYFIYWDAAKDDGTNFFDRLGRYFLVNLYHVWYLEIIQEAIRRRLPLSHSPNPSHCIFRACRYEAILLALRKYAQETAEGQAFLAQLDLERAHPPSLSSSSSTEDDEEDDEEGEGGITFFAQLDLEQENLSLSSSSTGGEEGEEGEEDEEGEEGDAN